MLSDSILSNAGWLFFAAYSAIVVVVSIAAFGPDLLPAKAQVDAPQKTRLLDSAQPGAHR
ncbi:MAG: hypothetical protein WCF26_00995 [Candidatus Sulfotelmatobacter sp.]